MVQTPAMHSESLAGMSNAMSSPTGGRLAYSTASRSEQVDLVTGVVADVVRGVDRVHLGPPLQEVEKGVPRERRQGRPREQRGDRDPQTLRTGQS